MVKLLRCCPDAAAGMRHLLRGVTASPLGATEQHKARVCNPDVERVESAWNRPCVARAGGPPLI